MNIPEEILLLIFSFLNEKELKPCYFVCLRWRFVSQDKSLLYYKSNKGTLEKIFLECCRKGYTTSIGHVIRELTKPTCTPSISHHLLWNEGFLESIKGGHIKLAKKILSFGTTPFEEALLECCHLHLRSVVFLLNEFDFRQRIKTEARMKALKYGKDDIAALLV